MPTKETEIDYPAAAKQILGYLRRYSTKTWTGPREDSIGYWFDNETDLAFTHRSFDDDKWNDHLDVARQILRSQGLTPRNRLTTNLR